MLKITYGRACMTTPKDKYYNTLLHNIVDDNNRKGAQMSNEKFQQAVGKVLEETES